MTPEANRIHTRLLRYDWLDHMGRPLRDRNRRHHLGTTSRRLSGCALRGQNRRG